MDILRFTLSGKTAFFKKPEVNAYYYFTYGCIHKVALLGIFGAMLGLKGYAQRKAGSDEFPEFYEKLKDVKVGIKINASDAYIPKKIQIFNNTVGYASKEEGGILNVRQQWLEHPSWDIYVLLTDDLTRRLADAVLNKKAVYMPYLGSNDHLADITDAKVFSNVKEQEKCYQIHSIMENDKAVYYSYEEFEEAIEEEEDLNDFEDPAFVYRYEECLPIGLSKELQMYETKNFTATNLWIKEYRGIVYLVASDNIVFF